LFIFKRQRQRQRQRQQRRQLRRQHPPKAAPVACLLSVLLMVGWPSINDNMGLHGPWKGSREWSTGGLSRWRWGGVIYSAITTNARVFQCHHRRQSPTSTFFAKLKLNYPSYTHKNNCPNLKRENNSIKESSIWQFHLANS